MTVQTTTLRADYTGNGSTTAFTVPFYFLDNTHVQVIRTQISTGTPTTLALTTDYTLTGAGVGTGGTATMVVAPTTDQKISILRNIPLTQLTHYVENDPFPAASHEKALDQLTMEVQQLQEIINRSLKISSNNTISSPEFNVSATARANKILSFDANGDLSVTQELGTYKGNWAASTAYAVRDIVKDGSNANIYICLTAHTSSGSTPISTNTDAAKWALLVDAATASTAATNAAASASAASTSASAASTSASAASTSASSASSSASTASTAATNASSSASSASSSASSASTSATNAAASAAAASAAVGGVKVTTNDTTASVLNNKLTVGGSLTKTTNNAGSNENLQVDVNMANNNTWTKAQRGAVSALTDGATITPDFAAANNFSVTLGGNRTLANPTNITAGQAGIIVITQDGTGSRTLAYGSYFKFPAGTAPTLTTTASAVDVLAYYVESSTRITARLIGDVK